MAGAEGAGGVLSDACGANGAVVGAGGAVARACGAGDVAVGAGGATAGGSVANTEGSDGAVACVL